MLGATAILSLKYSASATVSAKRAPAGKSFGSGGNAGSQLATADRGSQRRRRPQRPSWRRRQPSIEPWYCDCEPSKKRMPHAPKAQPVDVAGHALEPLLRVAADDVVSLAGRHQGLDEPVLLLARPFRHVEPI